MRASARDIPGEPVPAVAAHCPEGNGGSCELTPLGAFIDRSGLFDQVTVERCRRCGVGVSRPHLEDIAGLYADRSSQDFQPGTAGLAHLIKRVAFRRDARRLLADVEGRPGLVIDYGCGSGLFTHSLAEELGEGSRVVGADFHAEPPGDLSPETYRPNTQLDDLAGTADLVMAMHVVEHDNDPAALLTRIVALARPGGQVVIEVPHIDCVWAGVFGRFWDAWYLPYHRVHFSRTSFRALAKACGLTIVREVDVSAPTMGRTLANLMGRRNSLAFILAGALLHPIQWAGERLTRRPVAIRIVARKR